MSFVSLVQRVTPGALRSVVTWRYMVLINPVLATSNTLMAELAPGDTVPNSIEVALVVNTSDI